jgi:DNA invertase Pin-like site-specific DNA recombinase
MLQTFEKLKSIGIDVYFELENMHLSHPQAMLLLTIYASLAQNESESKRHNIRWGIRRGFERGESGFVHRVCYGFRSECGQLVIVPAEAPGG